MHISRLKLERFRGALDLTIDLHEKLNILVGMNGAGKSTVLDAAAVLLSWLINRIKNLNASGRPMTESDIKNGKHSSKIELSVTEDFSNFSWSLAKTISWHTKDVSSELKHLSEKAKEIQAKITEKEGQTNLSLFVYYPVNRAVLDIPLRIRSKHDFDLFSAFDESLTSGSNFRTFFEWFRDREDLENENRRHGEGQFPDPQLEAVRSALKQFMPEFSDLTIRRSPLRMEVKKNGERLTVNQLSDGEKCLMALAGDLARRMALANPVADNPLEGKGIVLIDEIDLHIHPKWQRRIIPNLRRVFPNCQFLISTHSPHVITHVPPESLFLLSMTENGLEALRATESYGKTADRVLEDLMGLETTRPDEVNAALQDIFLRIDKGELEESKKLIAELTMRIGEDAELTKANVLIRRKELIGK